MNQNPQQNKKPAAPPAQPQWNPYYRRNPDGTPGGHDQTLREQAARADASRQTAARRTAQPTPPPAGKAARPTPPPSREGLGQPVRRAAPAAKVRETGQREQVNPRPRTAPQKPAAPGGDRYRRNNNGTISRIYPRSTTRAPSHAGRTLLVAAAALLVLVGLIIGIVALVRGISPKIVYTYDYHGRYTAEVSGEDAMPGEVPYLNMNYLAAIYTMTVSGSYDDMKFSTADGEYVSLAPNSRVTMVNGNRHVMSEVALLRGQEMWIPSDFVEEMFVGITVKWDHEEHKVSITPATQSASDDAKIVPLTFKLRPAGGTATTPENWADGYEYLTDMSAYREAIEPANRDAFLILVNKENALSPTYVPSDLVDVTDMREGYTNTQKLCETAELALRALYQDLRAAGYTDVGVTSGYRTYKVQELLHQKYVLEEVENRNISRAEAEKFASRYSAVAGQSEHQTGLAVDMYNTASASVEFAESAAYAWLKDHAHQYGFILRYPADKTDVTGYDFEPWHYRYVGRYHATQMYEQGLCLEEYLKQLG